MDSAMPARGFLLESIQVSVGTLRVSIAALCILTVPGWCEAVCAWHMTARAAVPASHCSTHGDEQRQSPTWSATAEGHCGGAVERAPRVAATTKSIASVAVTEITAVTQTVSPFARQFRLHNRREHAPPGQSFALRI
jgi:hypothetical protein